MANHSVLFSHESIQFYHTVYAFTNCRSQKKMQKLINRNQQAFKRLLQPCFLSSHQTPSSCLWPVRKQQNPTVNPTGFTMLGFASSASLLQRSRIQLSPSVWAVFNVTHKLSFLRLRSAVSEKYAEKCQVIDSDNHLTTIVSILPTVCAEAFHDLLSLSAC